MPIIVIGGSPGSGKSTLVGHLRSRLGAPWVDFGRLREFHLLKPDWSDQSAAEESLAFENLVFILRNYVLHGYAHVLVDDLRDERIQQIPQVLSDLSFRILTLVVSNDDVLRERIIGRNDGWRDAEDALEWNRRVMSRPAVLGEHKIDTASKSAAQISDQAFALLDGEWPA